MILIDACYIIKHFLRYYEEGGKSRDSQSEQQCSETKLNKMLQNVEPPMQSIYRVPERIRKNKPEAYTPRIVSIGPFHRARNDDKKDHIFESMEELKQKYLKGFLNRTQVPMGDFVLSLQILEERIRSCYAEPIKYNSDDFLKMIITDACFIIELFLQCHTYKDWEGNPLLEKPWMLTDIVGDLTLLENQLPFFVLEQLYRFTGMNSKFPSFLEITFNYFKKNGMGKVCPIKCPQHLTDLLRTSIISSSKFHLRGPKECKRIEHLYSANQLWEAGLQFKVSSPNECLIDLTFSDEGVLTMPMLNVNQDTEILFRNIMAFEHCHLLDTAIITQYVAILGFLINTEKDVNVLIDNKIIVNRLGDTNAVATMINSLSSAVSMPLFNLDYFTLCNNLNNFYKKPHNMYKAIFIHEYFNTPWKIASTVAAVVLLLLTLIQTICSIISLF
ncbi:UPF0481 protein, partial [Mucuna pruriens]